MEGVEEEVALFSREDLFLTCRAQEAAMYEEVEKDREKLRDEIKNLVAKWKNQYPAKHQKWEERIEAEQPDPEYMKAMKEEEFRERDEEIEKTRMELSEVKQRLLELVLKAEQQKLGEVPPTDQLISRVKTVIAEIEILRTRASDLLAEAKKEKAKDRLLELHEECLKLEQMLSNSTELTKNVSNT
mmetsp:Transcript_114154/g.197374  ORF Transcript_114154/g.197374 Transcript_114154/m.197374 type:complete len:186 (+) Transcript_114154:1-558(+)